MRSRLQTKKKVRSAGLSFGKQLSNRFRKATSKAYTAAINAGVSVCVVHDGALWRVKKQGGKVTRTKIKDMPAPVPVAMGKKIKFAP